MNPLSVAASVAGIAAMSVQLSQEIYTLVPTFYEADKEMSSIANNLSLLAMVLRELEFVLRRDSQVYQRHMVGVVNKMLDKCHGTFQDISKYVSVDFEDIGSYKKVQRKIRWYFQERRVQLLQATLESMKSTLNVLLHVVNLARVTEEVETFMPNAGTVFTHADVQREKLILVGVVLDNRRSILAIKEIEEDRDRRAKVQNAIEDKPELGGTDKDVILDESVSTSEYKNGQTEMTSSWAAVATEDNKGKNVEEGKSKTKANESDKNQRPNDISLDPQLLASSVSHSADVVKNYETSETKFNGNRLQLLHDGTELGLPSNTDELSGPLMSLDRSLTQSIASEYFEAPPDIPITGSTDGHHSKDDIPTKPSNPQVTSAKGLASSGKKRRMALSDTNVVTPTAQWFLSIVPHELSVTALVARTGSEQATHLRARAEATARTLVLNWTNIDPDPVFGTSSGGWNITENSHFQSPGPARDQQTASPLYQMHYNPQPYSTYAPQPCYRPPVYSLPPSAMTATSPPPLNPSRPTSTLKQTKTDSEELARLKKLILDEKAEQDMRAMALLPASVPPISTDGLLEDATQRKNTCIEAVDSSQTPHEHNTLWKAVRPRVKPVIMRDWLGRKFIFPVDMCQTWAGLHNLIHGAFGHDLEYRPMVEKGKYLISQASGEYILPSTWEWFVKPGLEISMEMPVYDTDRSDSGGKLIMTDQTDKASTEQAKVEAVVKLERNRRLSHLKQELLDQGTAIQALEDTTEHADQDSKLAWLEKRVRDQKAELDRLSPLLLTPPGSSAGDSLPKRTSSPQRKASLGTRLFARMSSRSIRSRNSTQKQKD